MAVAAASAARMALAEKDGAILIRPTIAGPCPSVGWATVVCGFHFMVQPRMTLNPQDNFTNAPARWGGRALSGGPAPLDSGREYKIFYPVQA